MLVDANLLLIAVNTAAPQHEVARRWLEDQLSGSRRVGMPWSSLSAFLRIATHPRAFARPLGAATAWAIVEAWLAAPTVWVPAPTERHAEVFGRLVREYRVAGNLVPDAQLAAIALEHGLEVCSADTDFARFTEVIWRNPLAA